MAFTPTQREQLATLLRKEDGRQLALVPPIRTYLADFVMQSKNAQIAAARVLVQAEAAERNARLAAMPGELAAATTNVTAERDAWMALDAELAAL